MYFIVALTKLPKLPLTLSGCLICFPFVKVNIAELLRESKAGVMMSLLTNKALYIKISCFLLK